MRINSKEELQSKKAEIEQNIQNFTCRVLVCSGTGCMASGALSFSSYNRSYDPHREHFPDQPYPFSNSEAFSWHF